MVAHFIALLRDEAVDLRRRADDEAVDLRRRADRFDRTADALQRDDRDAEHDEEQSWRVQFWSVPPQTRIGVAQVAEGLGHSTSWVYKHTAPSSGLVPIPHRQLATGKLEFLVGEVRAWVSQIEVVHQAGPIERRAARRLRR